MGGKDNWGLTPANAFAGVTMRFTPDRRILIRQNIRYCPGFRCSDAERRAVRPLLDIGVRARFAWEIWRARAEA